MVTVYEVICPNCKGMFHMFTKDRSTKPRDGLLCIRCEKGTRMEEKRVIRTLRKTMQGVGEPTILNDLSVFCGFTQDATIFEPRMVNM